MRICLFPLIAAASCGLATQSVLAEERATITGRVADSTGKPVEHATVLVYSAGVKNGYAEFCPTCWTDCGKRTNTDPDGNFTISGLSNDLIFTLLVLHDGYSAKYVPKVDPAKGPAETATLKTRPPVEDTTQVVRGLVVDVHGRPLRDAVIEQHGAQFRRCAKLDRRNGGDQRQRRIRNGIQQASRRDDSPGQRARHGTEAIHRTHRRGSQDHDSK